jgi:hypothetical protein
MIASDYARSSGKLADPELRAIFDGAHVDVAIRLEARRLAAEGDGAQP